MDEGQRWDDIGLREEFLRLFVREQFRVLSFIRSLIHNQAAANDVFQEASLAMWRSFPTFDFDKEFAPWAIGIARHQVLKYWRTRDRDRHVFSEALVSELSREAIDLVDEMEPRLLALDECVKRLPDRQQDLIFRFYGRNQSASSVAKSWNRSVHTVYKALKVMRRFLAECVEGRMADEFSYNPEHPGRD